MKLQRLFAMGLLLLSAMTHGDLTTNNYFYFWADSYRVFVTPDQQTYIRTHLKSSDAVKLHFTINGLVLPKVYTLPPESVCDYPFLLGSHYTNNDHLIICTINLTPTLNNPVQNCVNIRLIH